MTVNRFSSGKFFQWHSTIYAVQKPLPDGRISIEAQDNRETRDVEVAELIKAFFEGDIRFAIEQKAKDSEMPHFSFLDVSQCRPEQRAVADYRYWVIQPLLELRQIECTLERVLARVAEVKRILVERGELYGKRSFKTSVSKASIYRWMSLYEQGGIPALIPSDIRGGKGKTRFSTEVEVIIQVVIEELYLKPTKQAVEDVFDEVRMRVKEENAPRLQEEQLKVPSQRTIVRRIHALGFQRRFAARRGKRELEEKYSQYEQRERPTRLLERVEIDHTRCDDMVLDDETFLPLGRPTITTCLDGATGYPLGFYLGFEPPSYLTVQTCLFYAFRPKGDVRALYNLQHDWITYGLPATLVVDNAKELIGNDLRAACWKLGITLPQTPVKTPHFKAMIERFLRSLNTGLIHKQDGTTFSNPQERGDYDSLEEATLTLGYLNKMFHVFLVDIYAETYHKGIEGVPARRWEAAVAGGFAPRLPSSIDELEIILARQLRRKVWHYGIDMFGLRYNCNELSILRLNLEELKTKEKRRADDDDEEKNDGKVEIKYHPLDLGCLYALNPISQKYIKVPAQEREYAQGLSLWQHRVITSYVRSQQDKVKIEELAKAKRHLRQLAEESRQMKKKVTRAKSTRFLTGGMSADQMYREAEAQKRAESDTPFLSSASSNGLSLPATTPLKEGSYAWNLDFNLSELDEEGWDISYDMPIKNSK